MNEEIGKNLISRNSALHGLTEFLREEFRFIQDISEIEQEGIDALKKLFDRKNIHIATDRGRNMVLLAGLVHRVVKVRLEETERPSDEVGDGVP